METRMLKTTEIKFNTSKLVILFAACLFMVRTAAATPPDTSYANPSTAMVHCLKVENNQVFFMVKYENADGGKFDVLVNDEYGENLYRGVFTGKNFHKTFRAPADMGTLVVIIKSAKDKDYHKFEVKAASKLVQQAFVKRM